MTHAKYPRLSLEDLVGRFTVISEAQYEAELYGQIRKFNALMMDLKEVWEELQGRPGDQRIALLPLLEHPNYQVRLNAAKATLALAPAAARTTLEALYASGHLPQSGSAGMTLLLLDNGTFKPT